MNTFFTELAAMLKDGQQMQLNISKNGESLTVMVTPNVKIGGSIHATGSTEEFDQEFLDTLKKELEVKPKFTMTSIEPEEKEEEDGADDKTETTDSGKGKAGAKKVGKKETTTKNKSFVVAEPVKGEAKAEPEKKEEEKAEPATSNDDTKKEEEAREANKKTVFDSIMKNAEKLESERKWKEALAEYQNASAYFPEDKKCQEGIQRTQKWVNSIAAIGL